MFNHDLRRRRRQRGFGLMEIALGLIVLMILSSQAMKWQARNDWIKRVTIVASQAGEIGGALSTYVTNNYGQLVLAAPVVAGFANPLSPTITELKTPPGGTLNPGFLMQNGLGSAWVLQVTKTPAACVPPACDLTGTVSLSSPVFMPGTTTIDEDGLGAMLQKIGADACYSTLADPTHCTAANGITIPNPLGNVAGIFTIKTNFGSSGLARFYARDGSTGPLTANLLMGGQSITNMQVVAIGSPCSSQRDVASGPNGEVVSCVDSRWKRQGSAFWEDPAQTYALLTSTYPCNAASAWVTRVVQYPSVGAGPRAYTCDGVSWFPLGLDDAGNLVVAGSATVGGNLDVTGNASANTLLPKLKATEGTSCAAYPEGTIAQSLTDTGSSLNCRNRRWQKNLASVSGFHLSEGAPCTTVYWWMTYTIPSGQEFAGNICAAGVWISNYVPTNNGDGGGI